MSVPSTAMTKRGLVLTALCCLASCGSDGALTEVIIRIAGRTQEERNSSMDVLTRPAVLKR